MGYDEVPKWQLINDELGLDTPEPPQWFSTSPELYEALSIPADAAATVGEPRAVIGASPRKASERGGEPRARGSRRHGSRAKSQSRSRRRTR